VILIDANLLLYAHIRRYVEHEAAHRWLDTRLNGTTRIGIPWQSLLAFLRVATNPRLFPGAESMIDAWGQVEEWLGNENVWIPHPTDGHAQIFATQISASRAYGNLIHDAHLAALAIEHGLELCSTDGDFARFPELRWTNPIR